MVQKISPFVEGKYGWDFGESGWNSGMDENILKFTFLFDRNIDSIVTVLPTPVNGQAHYLTTDNRIYFAVGTSYYSTSVPKWFEFTLRSTGQVYQFDGTSISLIPSAEGIESRLSAVELTISSLGSAAFADTSDFVSQGTLDVLESELTTYVDQRTPLVTPESFGAFSAATLVQAIDSGKDVLISNTTSITLQDSQQVQKVLSTLSRLNITSSSFTINLPSGHHPISTKTVVRSSNNSKIILRGVGPVETSITSISSVTGSAGAWTVTAVVSNAAGIEVGDTICVRGVTPGVQLPGTYTGRPPIGALQMQFFQNGELSLNGTTGSVTGSTLPTYVSSGDFLIADGKVKRMLNITASGFTVDSTNAPPIAYSGRQYWYTMRPSAAGTVTVSGTTVTGTSTTFLSRVNAGDLIAFMGYGIRKIASVDSDTQLTLTAGHPTISTGVSWGVITAGEMHEGAWTVTAVSGNQVTWVNTSRTSYGPPAKLINGGNIYALKTNLVYTGTTGFSVDGSLLEVNNIGIIGSGGSATVAFDLRENDRPGQVKLGTRVGVVGFHYGSRLSSGSTLQATSTHWGGQTTRCIDAAGGEARIGSACITGVSGIGVFVGEGAYARMSDTRVNACSLQGLRMEVGGSVWADFSVIGHNTATNVLVVGGVNIHFVGMRCFASGSSGLTGQNGGFGRATGITMLCNGYRGFDCYNGQIEANQSIVIGNTADGAVFSRGGYSVEEACFGYNDRGIYALQMANISASGNTQFVGNSSPAITSTARSTVYAPSSGYSANSSDGSALTGGVIVVTGQAGGTLWSPALNSAQANGSLITDA